MLAMDIRTYAMIHSITTEILPLLYNNIGKEFMHDTFEGFEE